MSLTRAGCVDTTVGYRMHPHVANLTFRPSTGLHPSGRQERSRKHTVRILQHVSGDLRSHGRLLDVASRLGLIGPIAEQCQHQ